MLNPSALPYVSQMEGNPRHDREFFEWRSYL